MGSKTGEKTLKRASMITFIILLSKLVGFGREAVVAAFFGTSGVASAYTNSAALLSYFSLFFTTAVSAAFMPIYTRLKYKQGIRKANRYANSVLNLFILLSVVMMIAAYFLAPQLSRLMWQGESEASPEIIALMTKLSRMMFPTLIFLAMTGVLCNVCNANERFVPEQLQGFTLSFCIILACVLYGANVTVEHLAMGTALSGVLHFILVLPFLKGIFKYQPQLEWRDPAIGHTFVAALPSLISLCFDEVNGFVGKAIASSISDSAPMIQTYSYRTLMLIQGILIVPILTIMFPQMSQKAARGDRKGFIITIRDCIEVISLITFPIIVLVCVLNTEIVGILFQRGKFTMQDTLEVASALVFYIIGLFGFGLRNFMTRAFFALQKNLIPMLVGIISVGIGIALSVVLSKYYGISGLLLASSISATLGAFLMFVILRLNLGPMRISKTVVQLIKIAIASGFCLGVTYIIKHFFPWQDDVFLHRFVRVLLAACGGLLVYIMMLILLRVRSMFTFLRTILKKPASKT